MPRELTKGPFLLSEARRAGITLSALKGKTWRRLGAELYVWDGAGADHWRLLSAWHRRLPREAVFAGVTAAWMLGLDFEPAVPVEVVVPIGCGVRSRPGLSVRRCELSPDEVTVIRGRRATAPHRTLTDLCARWQEVDALVAIDMAVRAGLSDVAGLCRHAAQAGGRPGVRRLRRLAELAAPAESPMETRLRWLFIQSGLPVPEVQTNLQDRDGRFVGRADLYFPAARLVVEYDGGNHRERLVADDRRQNLLVNAGFKVLRFTATDVYEHPDATVAQVRSALRTPSDRSVWRQTGAN